MADHCPSSLVRSKQFSKTLGYSYLLPKAFVDAKQNTTVRCSISWQNIDAFVKIPRPSILKRTCSGSEKNVRATSKQVLLNGKLYSSLLHTFCSLFFHVPDWFGMSHIRDDNETVLVVLISKGVKVDYFKALLPVCYFGANVAYRIKYRKLVVLCIALNQSIASSPKEHCSYSSP